MVFWGSPRGPRRAPGTWVHRGVDKDLFWGGPRKNPKNKKIYPYLGFCVPKDLNLFRNPPRRDPDPVETLPVATQPVETQAPTLASPNRPRRCQDPPFRDPDPGILSWRGEDDCSTNSNDSRTKDSDSGISNREIRPSGSLYFRFCIFLWCEHKWDAKSNRFGARI